MTIQVTIPDMLRRYTKGAEVVEVEGSTLDEVIHDLDVNYKGLRHRLIAFDGALYRFFDVCVNGVDVRSAASLATAVSHGDSVSIVPIGSMWSPCTRGG